MGGATGRERPWETTYHAVFLEELDLPGFERRESVHRTTPEPGDDVFAQESCAIGGFQVWKAGDAGRRFVDIRWLFPSVEAARRYHRKRMEVNREHLPPSWPPPAVGEGMRSFSGTDVLGLGLPMRILLFTVGPVAVKLFSSDLPPMSLDLTSLARRVEQRVRTVLDRSPPLPPSVPPPGPDPPRWPKGPLAYERLLGGEALLPGRGIGTTLTLGQGIPGMYQTLGGGDEVAGLPFVYLFVRGLFSVAVVAEWDKRGGEFRVAKIRYWDDPYGSLRTPQGITLGSSRQDVERAFGTGRLDENGVWVFPQGLAARYDNSDTYVTDLEVRPPIA